MIQHVYEDAVSLCYMHASCPILRHAAQSGVLGAAPKGKILKLRSHFFHMHGCQRSLQHILQLSVMTPVM
jgi:hypothetical protein